MAPKTTPSTDLPGQAAGSSAVVSELECVLEAVEDSNFEADAVRFLEGQDLIRLVLLAESIGQKIDVLRARVAARVEDAARNVMGEQSILQQLGMRNAVNALQFLTGSSAVTVRRRISLGQVIDSGVSMTGATIAAKYPAVGEGLISGHLGVEAAQLITRTLDQRTLRAASVKDLEKAEVALVALATGTSPESDFPQHCDLLRSSCELLTQFLDQDGPEPKDGDISLNRELSFGRKRQGLVPIKGLLEPELASLLGNLLDAVNNPRVELNKMNLVAEVPTPDAAETLSDRGTRNDPQRCQIHQSGAQQDGAQQDAASFEFGDHSGLEAVVEDHEDHEDRENCADCAAAKLAHNAQRIDDRSPAAKRHDAFMSLLGVLARHPDAPLQGGAPVTVLVQTTEQSLRDHLVQASSGSEQDSGSAENPMGGLNGFLYDHDGMVAPGSMPLIRQAGCSGSLQRVVFAENGSVNHISSPNRIFNGHQRKAILMRDGGCVIPQCNIPPSWCEIHHVVEWAQGGATTVGNGASLCWYHHRNIDTNGWHIKMIDNLPHVQAPLWVDPAQKWHRVRPPTTPPNIGLMGVEELGKQLLAKLDRLKGHQPNSHESAQPKVA